jgi:hypothetical protein
VMRPAPVNRRDRHHNHKVTHAIEVSRTCSRRPQRRPRPVKWFRRLSARPECWRPSAGPNAGPCQNG